MTTDNLVSIEHHNRLTAGPGAWTDTRVPADAFNAARAAYGTSSEDDDKRVYRTLQAALWKLSESQAPAVQAGNWYDLRPPMLVLGRTYKTNSGKEVRMVSISNAGTEHETMADEDGHHRYSRSHGRIIGRCTGSPNDDPLNIPFDPPPTSQPPVQHKENGRG